MNAFSRSWQLTKLTFGVIRKDKELIGFAFLSFLFSAIFSVAMLFPSVFTKMRDTGVDINSLQPLDYVLVFVTYFGLAFIATFFNVCTVYTTKVRFEGGNATSGESIRFALSKIGLITRWSLLSASVGLLLRILDNVAERLGGIGQAIAKILIALLGMAWSIITIFVVPTLVYENVGPLDAIKKSTATIKKTWGESIIKSIGLGIVQFITFLVFAIVVFLITYLLATTVGGVGAVVGVIIGITGLFIIGLVFNVASTVFNTALYVYANNGEAVEGFDRKILEGAFRKK